VHTTSTCLPQTSISSPITARDPSDNLAGGPWSCARELQYHPRSTIQIHPGKRVAKKHVLPPHPFRLRAGNRCFCRHINIARMKEEKKRRKRKKPSLLENDTTTTSKELTSPQDRVSIENPSCKTAVSNDISTSTNAKKVYTSRTSLPPPASKQAESATRRKKEKINFKVFPWSYTHPS